MTWLGDPEHLWIAVMVATAVALISVALFGWVLTRILRPELETFLRSLKERDDRRDAHQTLRDESFDLAFREFRRGLESVERRIDKSEKKHQGTARALGVLHQKVVILEGRPFAPRRPLP